ncbi:MAG: pyridoxal phosphate-dependent aminotransferase [Clostridia bacterium]|nr:pyridoxal phosphate-dependent aminotransferase [Clostridia bacterium]
MEREPLIYIDRRNTDCYKWDGLSAQFGEAELLPLWVADMDFQCPAAVRQAISAWAAHGVFGYYKTPGRYFDAFLRWEREEHGFSMEREWLRFSPGIVSALYWAVQFLTEPGDAVTVLTPVYYPFLNAVRDNARIVSACPLKNQGGIYSIDFDGLERLLDESGSRLLIFSSPHNPVGRVWTRDELERICRICEKRGVTILSDEIHQDLILGDKPHIPTASLGIGRVITCCSASKTFNIAGLKNAFVILPDDELRAAFDAYVKRIFVTDGPSVGYVAATAAFEGGKPWLRSLLEQVRENYQAACGELLDALPRAVISPLEGTYLMWIDLRDCLDPEKTKAVIQDACGLAVDYGEWFGGDEWKGFIRLNLATSMDNVMLAVRRIIAALTD